MLGESRERCALPSWLPPLRLLLQLGQSSWLPSAVSGLFYEKEPSGRLTLAMSPVQPMLCPVVTEIGSVSHNTPGHHGSDGLCESH